MSQIIDGKGLTSYALINTLPRNLPCFSILRLKSLHTASVWVQTQIQKKISCAISIINMKRFFDSEVNRFLGKVLTDLLFGPK